MSSDFRFITYAAQAHLDKLPAHSFSDRPDNAGLAHTGRSHKAEDRPLHILFEPQHSQVFYDPFLDLFHSVMVPVQDLAGPVQVQVVLGLFPPGKVQDPFDIGLADGSFRAARCHTAHPVQFLFALRPGFFIQRRFFHPLAQVGSIRIVAVAQFVLDRFDLFPQVVILLVLFHLLTDPCLDLLLCIRHVRLPHEDGAHFFQSFQRIQLVQDHLPVLLFRQHIGCQQVCRFTGFFDSAYRVRRLLAHTLGRAREFGKQVLTGAQQCFGFCGSRNLVLAYPDHCAHAGIVSQRFLNDAAGLTLHKYPDILTGQVHHLADLRNGADFAQILPSRIFDVFILLAYQKDLLPV